MSKKGKVLGLDGNPVQSEKPAKEMLLEELEALPEISGFLIVYDDHEQKTIGAKGTFGELAANIAILSQGGWFDRWEQTHLSAAVGSAADRYRRERARREMLDQEEPESERKQEVTEYTEEDKDL